MKTGRMGISVCLLLLLPVILLQGCGDGKGMDEFSSSATTGSDSPASVTVSASPANITGGDTTTTVTATVLGTTGSAVDDDTTVYFQFTNTAAAGFATGSSITASSSTTDGLATATITAGSVDGDLIVAAYTANGVTSSTLTVTVDHPELTITVSANPATMSGGTTSTIVTATVAYDTGEAVEDDTVIYFAFTNSADVDFATGAIITSQGSTSSGLATATVTAGSANGELYIVATTATGATSAALQVLVEDITMSVTMSGSTSIVAGGARVKVTATVETSTDVPVEAQTVTFSTSVGTLHTAATGAAVATTIDTSASGRASVYLDVIAGTTGTVSVTGRITGPDGEEVSGSLQIEVEPYQVAISPIDSIKANGIATALVRVNLKDGSGNVVVGEIVRFQTSLGAIATAGVAGVTNPNTSVVGYPTSETDANGDAVAELSAGNVSGTATVTIKVLTGLDDSNVANIVMTETTTAILIEVTPTTLVLNATPVNIVAGTGDIVTITGKLTDEGGDPIANQAIRFETSDPDNTSITGSATTSAAVGQEGEVSVNFSSGTVAGVFTIIGATSDGEVTQELQIEVLSADPFLVGLKDGYPDPTVIRVKGTGGQETSRLIFVVTDLYDNRVSDSLDVFVLFNIESGPGGGETVSPVRVQTSNGEAAVNLVAGFRTGTVKVKATLEENSSLNAVSTGIAIVEGPLSTASIGVVAVNYNIAGRVWMGLEDLITAYLADEAGDAVPDDTAVTFHTNETGGMFEDGAKTTTDGQCVDTLITTPNPVPVFGFISATAMADGEDSVAVQAIAVNAADRFFVGTDGAGIFKANDIADGLREWEEGNGRNHFVGPRVFDLVIPTPSPNVVFAATSLGLFKTGNQCADWMAARSPNNGNRIGFETAAPATCVAVASDYLGAAPTADRDARDITETDVLIGTAGYGIYYNVSAGMTYQIIDADGSASVNPDLSVSVMTDGIQAEWFDGSERVWYEADSDEPGGYNIAVDADNNGAPEITILDTDNDNGAFADMSLVNTFNSVPSPSYTWKYIDSNGNGTYDHGADEAIVDVAGWMQSPMLGTGVFVNRLASFVDGVGTDYAFAGSDSGLYRSSGALNGGPLGKFWQDVGDDHAAFTGVKITDVIVSDDNGDDVYDVFVSSWSNGMFHTADGDDAAITWAAITAPTGEDTLLLNGDGSGASADGDDLSIFLDTDNIMFEDVDGNGAYNGDDAIFIDADANGVYDTGETVLHDPGVALANGDTGISGVEANEWIRYVDTNGNLTYDAGVDDVYFDRDSDFYADVDTETYTRITALAYSPTSDVLYCATEKSGVFMSNAGAYDTWNALDTRLTGLSAARLTWATIDAKELLYIGGSRRGMLMEYNVTDAVYAEKTNGESNTKIDTSIMDRTPVLFSGHIAPRLVYDLSKDHITSTVDDPNETDNFAFALLLEDDFGNPPVAGTKITVVAILHEIVITAGANGPEEKDTVINITVGGFGDWTVPDSMSAGRGLTLFNYNILPQAEDSNYTGTDIAGFPDSLEYVEVTVTVEFPRDSNYGTSDGGSWSLLFHVDME